MCECRNYTMVGQTHQNNQVIGLIFYKDIRTISTKTSLLFSKEFQLEPAFPALC